MSLSYHDAKRTGINPDSSGSSSPDKTESMNNASEMFAELYARLLWRQICYIQRKKQPRQSANENEHKPG